MLTRRTVLTAAIQTVAQVQPVRASGTITFSGLPAADGEVVVGDTTFVFKASSPAAGQVLIGLTASECAANLADAINDYPAAVAQVMATAVGAVVTVRAQSTGVGGNALALTRTATNTTVSGSGTLSGGVGTPISPRTDAILCEAPDYTSDVAVLERNTLTATLTQQEHQVGRVTGMMSFTTEIRGNGKQHSGLLADSPILGRLFRACGYKQTPKSAASASSVDDVTPRTVLNGPAVSWVVGGSLTNTDFVTYTVKVTMGGASASAQVSVTPDVAHGGSPATGVTVTSAAALTIGNKGLTITPTWSGSLVVGQVWQVSLLPPGITYSNRSADFEAIALEMFPDGNRHVLTDAVGSFQIQADAAGVGKIKWTFSGSYYDPDEHPVPEAAYDDTLPPRVELMRLMLTDFVPKANSLTIDQANTVSLRPDVNSTFGNAGYFISARTPTGGVDPEAELAGTKNFIKEMSSASRFRLQARIGLDAGNRVWFVAPRCQYSAAPYGDREGIRTHSASFKMAGLGDDELVIHFC